VIFFGPAANSLLGPKPHCILLIHPSRKLPSSFSAQLQPSKCSQNFVLIRQLEQNKTFSANSQPHSSVTQGNRPLFIALHFSLAKTLQLAQPAFSKGRAGTAMEVTSVTKCFQFPV
jgi:hypothetical protein